MANDGKASIEVVGDVSNFAKQVGRDLDKALRDIDSGEKLGDKLGEDVAKGTQQRLRDENGRFIKTGEQVGSALGDGITRGADGKLRDSRGKFVKAGEQLGDSVRQGVDRSFRRDKTFLDYAKASLKDIGDTLQKGFSSMGKVLGPVLGTVGTVVGGAFAIAFVAAAAGAIVPALAAAITTGLGVALGAGLVGFGAFLLKDVKSLKDAFKDFGTTLKNIGQQAAKPLLKPLIDSFGILKDYAKLFAPDLKSIFKGLSDSIRPLAAGIGGMFGQIIAGIKDSMPGITAAFDTFSQMLPELGKVVGDLFRDIFGNEELIDNTTEGIMNLIMGPLKLLGPIISGLNVLFGVYNNTLILFANGWDVLWDAVLNFVDNGTGAIDRIREAFGPFGDAIQNVWDKLKAFAGEDDVGKLGQRFMEVVQAIKDAWGPLKDFIGVVWDEAMAFVKRVWEEEFIPWWEETAKPWLKEAIAEAFRVAWDVAVALVTGKVGELRTRISNGINAIPGQIRSALAAVPGIIGSVFVSASNRAISTILSMVAAVVRHFRSVGGKIREALGNVKNSITSAFAGAAGWLISAGSNIINGLISGIRSKIGALRSTLGGITASLPDWKGPAEVDRKILEPSGQMIMRGLLEGIKSERGSIQSALGDLTGSLAGWAGAGNGNGGSTVSGGLNFTINVSGATGQDAGQSAAQAVLKELAAAGLVR